MHSKRTLLRRDTTWRRLKKESNLNNNNKAIDLDEMKEKIEDEKLYLLQVLFQNKTIIFVNGTDYFQRTKRTRETREKLIEKSLIIIGDEFICEKSLIERYMI